MSCKLGPTCKLRIRTAFSPHLYNRTQSTLSVVGLPRQCSRSESHCPRIEWYEQTQGIHSLGRQSCQGRGSTLRESVSSEEWMRGIHFVWSPHSEFSRFMIFIWIILCIDIAKSPHIQLKWDENWQLISSISVSVKSRILLVSRGSESISH